MTQVVTSLGLSRRRACRLVGIQESSFYYHARRRDDSAQRERLRELAQQRPRFGCARLHILLQREGLAVNHKRTERIYREEGLFIRLKKRRQRVSGLRMPMPLIQRPNQGWSMDFVAAVLANGRRFRALTIVDNFTRECPGIEVDISLSGVRVARVLSRLALERGLPDVITVDNGPEFAGKALDEWAYRRGVKLNFIRPGKPVENAYAESFNGRFRDECLNEHWFQTLIEARTKIESWREDYNSVRPHSSLGNLTPNDFAAKQPARLGIEKTLGVTQ